MTQELVKQFRHATVSIIRSEQPILLVTATSEYMPLDQFKEVFISLEEPVGTLGVQKVIFDKRKLSVFHQPSMVWYFTDWKERMFDLGLTTHVKLLPQDEVFKQSVLIGRNKINADFPKGKFHRMKIVYVDSLEEAVTL